MTTRMKRPGIGIPALCLCVALAGCVPSGPDWIHGVDVSHHQPPLDWEAMKSRGIRFAYVKATEGADWSDAAYRKHEEGARAQGLAVGAYHFFTFCADGEMQATHFLAHLDLRPGDLPPAVDVEAAGNCLEDPDRDSLHASLEAFSLMIERAIGRKPLIYTTQFFYWKYFPDGFGASPFWIRNLLWCPDTEGLSPFCQYDVSRIPEATADPVDRNAFRGGEARFQRFLYRPKTGR
jgi:lysozyme